MLSVLDRLQRQAQPELVIVRAVDRKPESLSHGSAASSAVNFGQREAPPAPRPRMH
jgi:hypothetical protein